MCTINSHGRTFGPDGCQVPVGSGTCGETKTLQIINEFKRLYEEKIQEIESSGGGDCHQEKIKLQQDWIGDLTAQNEMLVKAVEELEHEATERVHVLEEKLQQSAQSICEVMKRYREYDVTNDLLAEPLQKMFSLESDQKNLLEFIRRVREENRWDVNGLKFYEISYTDLFGSNKKNTEVEEKTEYKTCDSIKRETKLKDKEGHISELKKKLEHFNKYGDVDGLSKELESKKEECLALKKSMKDTQQALVEEIASKHDSIVQLRKECQQLEERCMQADKQTAFRDDIIKELRKEIKLLKQQKHVGSEDICEKLKAKVEELKNEKASLEKSKNDVEKEKMVLEVEKGALEKEKNSLEKEKNSLENGKTRLEKEKNTLENENRKLQKENYDLKKEACTLEKEKKSLEAIVRDNKSEIDTLGKDFNEFLKVKGDLKKMTKLTEKKFNDVSSKNKKLKDENQILKADIENLAKTNKQLEDELAAAQEDAERLKCNTTICEGTAEDNEKLLKQLFSLNEENRGLLKTVENQRKRIDRTTKLTQDEMVKLNATIDELHNDLQKTKLLQEQEEKRYREKISHLKDTIKRLACSMKEAEEKHERDIKICKICRGRAKVGFAENAEVQASPDSDDETDTNKKRDEIIKIQDDTINVLQKEVESLKERECNLTKDRESMCGELDILRNRLSELEKTLNDAEKKAVQFQKAVQASLDEADSEEEMETIKKRDEIIKVQGDTINLLQQEVESLKEKECDFAKDRESKCGELQTLRNRVSELENAVNDAEGKAVNLQKAVDLYLNSLNVLEASEDKYKTEIEQQKLTISNLQKALVATKQELDDIKLKSQENEHEQHGLINCFNVVMSDMEVDKEDLSKQCKYVTDEYEHLQDMNFDLELEHCTSLQDVEILENQLFKYQSLLRSSEDECNQYKNYCKKLAKQKKCYEDVVAYFKQEMGSMSEQLCNLQELLNMSNESNQEETCKLMQAYKNVQDENDKLSTQLAAAEQKADLESQMNQLHETKISELQNLISERELDLSRHDQAILNIRQSLQCSLAQNEELQSTIVKLHDTIAQLQNAVHTYEKENCRGREGTEQCWAQIRCCKQRLDDLKSALDDKTTELCKLEMAYNDQTRALKSAQMELNQIREKQKDKQRHLKTAVEDLRQKLVKSEENYCKVCCEFSNLQGQLTALARKEAVKDLEVKRYRKIVGDLKNTLIDLNKSLASGKSQKLQNNCKHAECKKRMQLTEEAKNQDICFNCPCEVEFYQSIVETLKKSVIDLKKRLNETEEAGKLKDAQLEELSKEKEKEYNDLRRKLTEKLKQAQTEEARYLDLASQLEKELNSIRQELEVKTLQLNDVKRSAQEINSTKCIQLVCAQEEVNSLKEELNRILRQHCTLNAENEKLHAQSACMQGTVSKLEEKSQLLKGQLEQYLTELQSVQTEKESLVRKNYELLSELRSLQCTFNSVHKQQTRECPYLPSSQRPKKVVVSCIKSPPPTCPSPWSLGSQGTASAHDVRSPSRSPCPDADECDWYSSTFRNESEDEEEEDEEDWVTKVEHLAAQVRRTNKIWKNKMGHPDDVVSRDTKK